jgi:hypothetical protein
MRWCSNDRPQRPLLSPKDRLPDPQDRLDDRRSCPRRKRQRARRERRRESQRAHDTEQLALPEPQPNNKVPKDSLQSRRASVSPQRVSWPTLVGPTLGEFHASASPSKGMRSLPTSCASHQRIAAQHRHPVTRRKPGGHRSRMDESSACSKCDGTVHIFGMHGPETSWSELISSDDAFEFGTCDKCGTQYRRVRSDPPLPWQPTHFSGDEAGTQDEPDAFS